MKYFTLLVFLLCCACGQNTQHTPPPPQEIGLETESQEDKVIHLRQVEDYNPDGDERPLDDLIRVADLPAESVITSPFTVRGEARGTWFFEGSFPIALYDENGKVLNESFGHSPESWMTEAFIPFSATIEWDAPAGTKASLELMLDNPAGDEGMDRSVVVPVVLE